MSNFKSWTRDNLKERFGLKRVYQMPIMTEWLSNTEQISTLETQILLLWHQDIQKYIDYWNEEEVKLKFIGNILEIWKELLMAKKLVANLILWLQRESKK
jgi:hypothetical protein